MSGKTKDPFANMFPIIPPHTAPDQSKKTTDYLWTHYSHLLGHTGKYTIISIPHTQEEREDIMHWDLQVTVKKRKLDTVVAILKEGFYRFDILTDLIAICERAKWVEPLQKVARATSAKKRIRNAAKAAMARITQSKEESVRLHAPKKEKNTRTVKDSNRAAKGGKLFA